MKTLEESLQASWQRLYRWAYQCRWLFVVTLLVAAGALCNLYQSSAKL